MFSSSSSGASRQVPVNDPATTVRTGSCLCGSVRYEITGDPFSFRVCHCQNCRKATGSAFMTNGFFQGKQVHITQGKDTLRSYADPETATGVPLHRYFCSKCGSNVLLRSEASLPENITGPRSDVAIVALGTVDKDHPWKPRVELWPELRRPFVTAIDTTKPKPAAAAISAKL
ncbi:hypothetical protein D9619_005132 [Psilocybe cf. subviscida]|uniref:CENP-V/GFA domain-containing protein n=1 Tax=Psilocybe cf. subviscida TaxID=2480587 RepID=A0A8H5BQ08_9AGAR|nr:hypothetical protein D9619_005132 [Psilocybe cf. subviscida]